MSKAKKLKRAVIKEEYVAITGNYIDAIILNQFIYWSERVDDFDKFILQERERAEKDGKQTQELTNGWIYKTADELSQETMLSLSASSMRTHIKSLINQKFIDERENPEHKWDRTKQYRVNLVLIDKTLRENGYTLEGYKFEVAFSKNDAHNSETENGDNANRNAIPKTTTETTSQTTSSIDDFSDFFEQIWKRYPRKLGKGSVTKKAKQEIFDNKADFEKALENFLRYLEVNQTDEQYIPYGSTFFNTLWRDFVDYEAKATTPKKHSTTSFYNDDWLQQNWAKDTDNNDDLFGED